MKQRTLFDSFLKKNKTSNDLSSSKTHPVGDSDEKEQKKKENLQHMDNKVTQNPSKPVPLGAPTPSSSQFNSMIQSDNFAYSSAQHPKRKKMQILEEEHQKPIPNHCEDVLQSAISESSDKPKKRVGRPPVIPRPPVSVRKPGEEEKIKRAVTEQGVGGPTGFSNTLESMDEFTDVTPEWATAEGCRDANHRRPDHPDYDPSTLFVPEDAIRGLTETMKQYWRIKSTNFDKIVLFKLGKFYQMFYEDAVVGNKTLDLKWMGTKMHVGFPEKCLDKYTHEFAKMGFKLVVVEQLQTPDQMKERMATERSQGIKAEKTLKRGITQVVTKGTLVSFDESQYLPNYLVAVWRQNGQIAYALLEMGVNLIMVGLSKNLSDFKTMLFQTRPVELLYDPDNLPLDIVEMMRQKWLNMVLTKQSNRQNSWHFMNAKNMMEDLVRRNVKAKPAVFEALQKETDQDKMVLATLSGMFRYLKDCLKFDYIMSAVRIAFYEQEGSSMSMVLDSQALQHLEIFQTPLGQKDSLFSKFDRTTTRFGRRLLRRWLTQPLLDPRKINQRLDAVEDLRSVSIERDRAVNLMKHLPDLEKIINRLYHYSVKTIAEKAIYFEDVSGSRLKEFKDLMQYFNKAWAAIEYLRVHKTHYKSHRLVTLLTIKRENSDEEEDQPTQNGLLPALKDHLHEFDQYIRWEDNIPRPQKGLVASYDMLQQELSNSKVKMEEYLDQVRRATGLPCLKYVHTKEKYQIEIPEDLEKNRLEDMIFTSKRSGYSRYVTNESRKLVGNIEYIESQIKDQMGLFVGYFFEEFRKKQRIWEGFVEILGEVDCLISMSLYSEQIGGFRPKFSGSGFEMIQAKHPCLNPSDVIPNDIALNKRVMLLTGPNMGGKSTLLRTACLNVVLAQTGSCVPCEYYDCQIIDRIFTRIGASDKLEEGKSTFFIEMEETESILTHGTANSLAIIDELGRGTSTFDGMSIAQAVLRDVIERIHCRCMFATHYHSLAQQFSSYKEVSPEMMDYMISKKDDKVLFLYKLKQGSAQQSFANNVGRVVGLPESILKLAKQKADEMEMEIKAREETRRALLALSQCNKEEE